MPSIEIIRSYVNIVIEYFSGIKKWQLVLQYDKPTERDGPYNGGTAFSNAWLYGTAEFPIELK